MSERTFGGGGFGPKKRRPVGTGAIAQRIEKLRDQERSDDWLVEILTRLESLETEVAQLKAKPVALPAVPVPDPTEDG